MQAPSLSGSTMVRINAPTAATALGFTDRQVGRVVFTPYYFKKPQGATYDRHKRIPYSRTILDDAQRDSTPPAPCENPCEKNFPKSAKTGKNRKRRGKKNLAISNR
jgi:hypothetical protein